MVCLGSRDILGEGTHNAKVEKVWDKVVTLYAASLPRLGSDSAKDGGERKGKRALQEHNSTSLYFLSGKMFRTSPTPGSVLREPSSF